MASQQLNFMDLVKAIEEKSTPNRRDEEHATITNYVNMFLGKFGKEGCRLVGSTAERTRVRLNRNEADSDFIMISGKAVIPTELLEYHGKCPCFVSVKGQDLLEYFDVELVDGKYLPADLLRKVRPEAFSLLRIVFKAMTKPAHTLTEDETPRDTLQRETKVGAETMLFSDADMNKKKINPVKQTTKRNLNMQERRVADFFKVICDILMSLNNESASKGLLQKNIPLLFQLLIPGQLDLRKGQDDIEQVSRLVEEEMNLKEDDDLNMTTDENKPEVTVRYSSVHSMDYVPCFRLSGPPKGFELWIHRDRSWPTTKIVENIAKSEFFLVAKPALVDGRQDTDFCISFTAAEKILFDEVYKVPAQRRCYLVIKALHKAIFQDQNILKTFHWKTIFLWTSEKRQTWTDDDLSDAVSEILDAMLKSLENRVLEHFFIKSNLFEHLKNKEMEPEVESMLSKVKEIRADVTSALKIFLRLDKKDDYDITTVPASDVKGAEYAKRGKFGSEGPHRFKDAMLGFFQKVSDNAERDSSESKSAANTNEADHDTSKVFEPEYDTSKVLSAATDVFKQVNQDFKNDKRFLTKLHRPFLSAHEADLIGRAAELLSPNERKAQEENVTAYSRDLAKYFASKYNVKKEIPNAIDDIDLD